LDWEQSDRLNKNMRGYKLPDLGANQSSMMTQIFEQGIFDVLAK